MPGRPHLRLWAHLSLVAGKQEDTRITAVLTEESQALASPAEGKLSSECETDEVPAVNPRDESSSSAAFGRTFSPAGSVPVRLSMSTGHRFTDEPRFAPRRGRQEVVRCGTFPLGRAAFFFPRFPSLFYPIMLQKYFICGIIYLAILWKEAEACTGKSSSVCWI